MISGHFHGTYYLYHLSEHRIPYRNQSFDLQCKSKHWLLQKGNAGLKWVNQDNQTIEYASPIIEIKILLIFDNTNIQSADTQKHLGYIHHYKLVVF